MLGLCLVAVLALAAVAASGASGLEWGKCEAKAGGNYTEANCKTKAKPKGTGGFEWLKASQVASKRVAEGKSAGVPFKGESVGSEPILTTDFFVCRPAEESRISRKKCAEKGEHTEGGEQESALFVSCDKETATGETVAKSNVEDVNVTFTGCLLLGSAPCTGAGLKEGEVKTSTLKGKLGWIKKSAKEVGVVLEPAKKHAPFAVFNCAELITTVGVGNAKEGAFYEPESHGGYDEIISPVTPVNEMTSKLTQTYTENGKLENVPNKFEGKHRSSLEDVIEPEPEPGFGSLWQAAAEELTNVNTSEEPGEIKA